MAETMVVIEVEKVVGMIRGSKRLLSLLLLMHML